MSTLFLTADEVSELTGYKLPARQRVWVIEFKRVTQ